MSGKARTSLLSLAIIVVLVFSAFGPSIAYADEGAPPEETSTEVTGNPEETSTEEETDTSADKETAPAEGEAATDAASDVDKESAPAEGEAATDAPADKESAPAEGETAPVEETAETPLLSEVPENTTVTVLDENGEAQPLVTQEAAEAIAASDPIWCPGTQAPTPGANGCTESFPSFDELLTYLAGNEAFQGAGTIFVEQGGYQGDDPDNVIDFNSYNLSNINNANLTVMGGWNTSTNAVDASTPTVFTDYSLLIGSASNPWGGSLVLQNITLQYSELPDFQENVNGITLHAENDITVVNVSVTGATGVGAELHAGSDPDDDVNIGSSNFQQNVRGGVIARGGGNVNVANSNFGNPMLEEDRWQRFGLDVESGGATSLSGVIANLNREAGVNIVSNGRVTIANSVFSGTKEMWDDENGNPVFLGYGLQVVTPSSVELFNVTGNDNFLWGARLDVGGDIAILDSVFNANTTEDPGFIDDTGLFLFTDGNVALDNVTANGNRLYGAQIEAAGTVSINNSTFNDNRGVVTVGGVTQMHGHGLQIVSLADIFINNTNAVGNMLFGGQLTAAGEVAISESSFSNTQTDDASVAEGTGLEIVSGGNTSLSGVVLDNNQSAGADIDAGGDVFLTDVTATNNGTDGVAVQASCTHVFGGTYTGNGQYGINLVDSALNLASPPVFGNNGAGNIFPANPVLCPGTSTGGSEGLTSLSALTGTTGFGNVTLSSFLANSRVGTGSQGIFIGQYMYVHSLEGLQIFALDPASQLVAMAGS